MKQRIWGLILCAIGFFMMGMGLGSNLKAEDVKAIHLYESICVQGIKYHVFRQLGDYSFSVVPAYTAKGIVTCK